MGEGGDACMAFLGLKLEGKYCFVRYGGLAHLCVDRSTYDQRVFSVIICVRKNK
jgi:hypothetical protein